MSTERAIHANTTHGLSHTTQYNAWKNMMHRCYNSTDPRYADYGGRGIVVCERWHHFLHFYRDIGPRPSLYHSIERLNNDGPYSPDNTVWATGYVQARNTRANRLIPFQGKTLCITDWASMLGLRPETLSARLLRYGWSVERALSTPADIHTHHAITFQGQTLTLMEWASKLSIPHNTLRARLVRYGWTVERALTTPVIKRSPHGRR